jgi:hypothetical protein
MSDSQKPPLTLEDVREILRILENSAFDKLELEVAGFRLMLQRGSNAAAAWDDALQAADIGRSTEVKRRRLWWRD